MEISNSRTAAVFFRNKTQNADVEEFWAIALNSQCQMIHAQMLFRGTVDACFTHPRDVFRFAILHNASTLIVGHNHPSGACFPSQADMQFTNKLKECGELLQIPIVDHVIVTKHEHYSFADRVWRDRFRSGH
jgi:DNA repair protein RadC